MKTNWTGHSRLHTYVLIQEYKGVPLIFATRTDGINCSNSIGAFFEKDKDGELLPTIEWNQAILDKYDEETWAWVAEVLSGVSYEDNSSTFRTASQCSMEKRSHNRNLEGDKTL